MAPAVSILTPIYNRSDYMPDAIASVLAQDMPDWELIISDNISSDASPEIAQRYAAQDERIKFFRNEVHVSAVENFNLCYHRSDPDSTYVALLASDDWWEPTFLSRTLAIGQEYPHVAFVHTDMYRTDREKRVLNRYSDLYQHNTPSPGLYQDQRGIFYGTYINIMAAIINRKVKESIYPTHDLLDPDLKLTPDFHLWLQLLIRGAKGYYIPEPLAYYRKHEEAMTMPARMINRLQEEVQLFTSKMEEYCPSELEEVRRDALQQRYASLGMELLTHERAPEAAEPLREAQNLATRRRLDVTVARMVVALPCSPSCRASAWRSILSVARKLGRTS